ncbi:nickel pincer cofactor biosynthesis protein LarC, partial [Candidatus Bathyarchaeota archaeon]
LVKIVEQASIDLGLSEKARAYAVKVIKTLIYTEAKIHGENLKDVHLHEAGAIDTPAEIIGSAVALESLGLFDAKFYSTPVAVGGGTFKFSHGIVSSPAPATLEILSRKGVPIIGGPVKAELTTPTGASILASLVDEVSYYYPPMVPMKIGYGAGTREFREIPNLLRIVVGNQQSYGLLKDEVMIVETNLDDVTGEVIGYLIEKLLDEGVRDVSVIPIFTKKSRPAHIVRVITDRTDVERIARILMEETGSLGVRVFPCERRILSRKVINVEITVKDKRERVNVKVATDSKGKIIQVKPEYEDLKRISRITGIPLRRIREIAEEEAKKKLKI